MTTPNKDEIEYYEAKVMELENMRVFYTNNGDMEQAAAYEDQMESVLDGIEDLEDEEEDDVDYDMVAAASESEEEEEEAGGGGEEEEEEGGGDEEVEMMVMQQEEEAAAEEEEAVVGQEEMLLEEEEEEKEEEEEEELELEEEEAAQEEAGEEESDPMDASQYDPNELYQAVWEKIQEQYPSQEASFAGAEKKLLEQIKKLHQQNMMR